MRNRIHYTASQIGINAKAATGVGNTIDVRDFRNAVISLGTASSGSMTVKIYGAIGDTAPTFSSAASATNQWQTIDLAPLNAAGVITDGDTGLVWSGTDKVELVEVNTNALDFLVVVVTAYTAGTVTGSMTLTTNE